MNSIVLEVLFPALIVTLFSVGCLATLLRRNALHVLFGILLMGWSSVLLLASLADRNGKGEGLALAVALVGCLVLQVITGIALVQWRQEATGSVDLDK